MMQFNTLFIVLVCGYLSFETNNASKHFIINGILARIARISTKQDVKDSNTNH